MNPDKPLSKARLMVTVIGGGGGGGGGEKGGGGGGRGMTTKFSFPYKQKGHSKYTWNAVWFPAPLDTVGQKGGSFGRLSRLVP